MWRQPLHRGALALISLATTGLVVVTALTLVGGGLWPLSLFEHFRIQYLVAAVPIAAAALALRRWRLFDLCTIALLINLCAVAPALRAEPLPAPADAATLRVLLLNVHTESSSHDQVRALIAELDPDVLALIEVDRTWLDALAPVTAGYRGRIEEPRSDNFGIALYHRGALDGGVRWFGVGRPSIVAELEHDGAVATVIATHPIPPVSSSAADSQRAQLDGVADAARAATAPVVLLGDLNATPWSRPFARLAARSGLLDTRAGFGVQASFPASSAILRIPIDHALVSPGVGVRTRRVERDVGSDHLPVYLELALPRRR